jgi:mono/diheme cytochrome c family protein
MSPRSIVHSAKITERWLMSRLQIVLLIFLGLLASTMALAQAPTDVGLTQSPAFEKNCAKCHGKTADGRHFGGPSLRSDKVNATSVEELRNIISNGKGRMPKYSDKLSAEEIDALVKQIKALK